MDVGLTDSTGRKFSDDITNWVTIDL
jgi:hypothetical protein